MSWDFRVFFIEKGDVATVLPPLICEAQSEASIVAFWMMPCSLCYPFLFLVPKNKLGNISVMRSYSPSNNSPYACGMETFLFKERFTFVPTNLQSSAFHIILGTMTTTFSLRLQRHPTREHTLTHNRTILPSCGTPLLFLSSCLSCEYWFMVKWSNPLEVKKAWHGVIAKWQTFDGSEKNEITSLTSWEITISLFHTHTHADLRSPPALCVRRITHGHRGRATRK